MHMYIIRKRHMCFNIAWLLLWLPTYGVYAHHVFVFISWYNSTRRAPWHARLGLQRQPSFAVSFASLRPGGGFISCIHVMITRMYPMSHMEMMENGIRLTRNEKAEAKAYNEWEREWERKWENIKMDQEKR